MKATNFSALVLVGAGLMLCGCAPAYSRYSNPGESDHNSALYSAAGQLAASAPGSVAADLGSLFKEDEAVISNDEMGKVLAQKITVPPQAKIVVVRYGDMPHWSRWSETVMRANEAIDHGLLERLEASSRVGTVTYLPSMVMPREMTIPRLRHAAARCQADMLLIYRTATRNYDRERLLSAHETRAYCTVEAILLDTRTGLIPFSTAVNETFSARKTAEEIDFQETIVKARNEAIGKAWLEMANAVGEYLNGLPAAVAEVEADQGFSGGSGLAYK